MTKVLVLYHSSYGHIETMAGEIAAGVREVPSGSPYGAGTIAGPKGDRTPTEKERAVARYQGRRVAEIAKKQTGAA